MATLKQRFDLKTNGENLLSEDNYCTKFDNFQAMWSKDIERSKFVQTPTVWPWPLFVTAVKLKEQQTVFYGDKISLYKKAIWDYLKHSVIQYDGVPCYIGTSSIHNIIFYFKIHSFFNVQNKFKVIKNTHSNRKKKKMPTGLTLTWISRTPQRWLLVRSLKGSYLLIIRSIIE